MKEARILRRYSVWFVACLLFLLGAVQLMAAKQDKKDAAQTTNQPSATAAADASQYVGSETCKGCHEDQFKNTEASPHYRIFSNTGRGEQWHGCESCHGPGAAHVNGGGDKTKIFTFKDVKPEEITARCLTCHEKNAEHMTFNRSVHARAGVTCTTCHSVHKPKVEEALLVQKSPDLCYSCHQEVRADFNKPFRHRVNEGLIGCSDCHNVHGTSLPVQLRSASAQDAVCFKCHADKRGPFVFEHYPVKSEGCQACHTPHGSTNPRLLTRARVNSLCLECHGDVLPSGPHPQNTKSQACTMCHMAIHGSNTSNILFR